MTGGMIMLLSCGAMAFPESSVQVYYDNDVTPPWGRLIITGVTEVDNSNYEDRKVVEVQVYASDDKCSDNEIKYYLSTSEISDTTKITDWKDYSTDLKVNVTLPSTTSLNKIYAVFKDANGNTSLIYSGSNLEQTITYNVNASDATIDTGLSSKRTYGAPFVVTTRTPERTGYFFKGWGLSASDTTPSFYAGDIIPADMSIGTDSAATLYAIWTTEIEGLPKLADVVKVGDYVNYPVYYDNVTTYNGSYTSTYKGWRVISKDVDIDGNESIGTVNLISAGVPLTYYHNYGDSTTSVENLAIKFLTTPFHASDKNRYRKTGFNPYKTLTQVFTNKYTATYASDTTVTYPTYSTNTVTGTKTAGTLKVRAMTMDDIKRATGLSSISYGTSLTDASYQNLFNVGAIYWLASAFDSYYLWYVNNDGSVSHSRSLNGYGVRPAVSLKSEVRATGTDAKGAWNIELPDESPKLADVVEVGDYVNYPVDYENVETTNPINGTTYTSTYKGWRVLSKDVDIDGNESIGTVNLISAGVPLTYYHAADNTATLKNLLLKFLTTPVHATDYEKYRKTGFDANKTLTEIFTNKYTATYTRNTSVTYPTYSTNTITETKTAGTLKVRAMTIEDVKKAGGIDTIEIGTKLTDAIYKNLFEVGAEYWFASVAYVNNSYDENALFRLHANGSVYGSSYKECGIRPVVSLKPEVKATSQDANGAWNIEL